ncbi:MAG TPA: BON domain-containing protein [Usitatibacter sp.]|jgi:osmotically-inducible protein OsmY|nr:BON domain-containing protein [Usitatibacter sp.]
MKRRHLAATAGLAVTLAALAACDRTASDGTVGQKLDRAVERTQQSLEQAGEKTRETLRENAPTVEQKLSHAGHEIEAATEKTVDRTREAVADHAPHDGASHDTAPAGKPASSAGSAPSDFGITASIKADLVKDPDLSALKIDVDTHDGVVTLNGLANDEAGRQRAERMAQAVKGVREVHNYLTVKRG